LLDATSETIGLLGVLVIGLLGDMAPGRAASASHGTRFQRLVHDLANGARAATALGAAAEASVDLPCRARTRGISGAGRANVLVAQYVTRTDNHRGIMRGATVVPDAYRGTHQKANEINSLDDF
jgi:hypothetical protein